MFRFRSVRRVDAGVVSPAAVEVLERRALLAAGPRGGFGDAYEPNDSFAESANLGEPRTPPRWRRPRGGVRGDLG